MAAIEIREVRPEDIGFLEQMLREAAAGSPERPRQPSVEVLATEQTARYVTGWGRRSDVGRIAQLPGEDPLGAAWYRRFTADAPGYGFVAAEVPELSLAVAAPGARGAGIGTALTRALIAVAVDEGYPALSLSVALVNPALRLYERLGFVAVSVTEAHQTMRLEL